jgi:hypothetical protein
MRLSHSPLLLGLLAIVACDPDPRFLEGSVTDIFGKPIPEATVLVEGWEARATTDAAGVFQVQATAPGEVRMVAGAEGYVKDFTSVTVPVLEDLEAEMPKASFSLWNKPEKPGFYAKGAGELVALQGAKVTALGSDLSEMHGVRDIPEIEIGINSGDAFLFGSTLRSSEITQLDLKLFSLKFLEETEVKGITGQETVEPKFWVADVEAPFTLRGLYADDTFVIEPDAKLEPGIYAFATQGILVETDPGSLDKIPVEQRQVFPFEIK